MPTENETPITSVALSPEVEAIQSEQRVERAPITSEERHEALRELIVATNEAFGTTFTSEDFSIIAAEGAMTAPVAIPTEPIPTPPVAEEVSIRRIETSTRADEVIEECCEKCDKKEISTIAYELREKYIYKQKDFRDKVTNLYLYKPNETFDMNLVSIDIKPVSGKEEEPQYDSEGKFIPQPHYMEFVVLDDKDVSYPAQEGGFDIKVRKANDRERITHYIKSTEEILNFSRRIANDSDKKTFFRTIAYRMNKIFSQTYEIHKNIAIPERIKINEKRINKEKKEIDKRRVKNNPDSRSWFFAPVGIEYTYHFPKSLKISNDEHECHPIRDKVRADLEELAKTFGKKFEDTHIYVDRGPVLEIGSPIHKNWNQLIWWYKKIDSITKSLGLTSWDPKKGSGGGHINIGIPIKDEKLYKHFIYNLIVDTANRPYLNWIFNEPSDNRTASAILLHREYQRDRFKSMTLDTEWNEYDFDKGSAIRFKNKYCIEFRFFDTHRNLRDLHDAVRFVNAWLLKIKKDTEAGIVYEKNMKLIDIMAAPVKKDEPKKMTETATGGMFVSPGISTVEIDTSTVTKNADKKLEDAPLTVEETKEITDFIYQVSMSELQKNKRVQKLMEGKNEKAIYNALSSMMTQIKSPAVAINIFGEEIKPDDSKSPLRVIIPTVKSEFKKMLESMGLDYKDYSRFVVRNFNKRIKQPYGDKYLV